jgi:NitT/TauT family transport system substrate-binding protein
MPIAYALGTQFMRFTKRLAAFTAPALLSLFVMLLLGCRDQGQKQTPGKNRSASNPAQVTVDSLFTIRFTPQWHHQSQFAGFYMALRKGSYSNYGLNVIIQDGGSDNPAYEALQSGSTDIITLFLLTAMNKGASSQDMVNLAQFSQRSTLMLVGKKSRGINSVESLQGKKIGLWHSDFRDLSLAFFARNKLKVEVVPIDWTNTLFIHDAVDLINVMYYNEYHSLLMSGIEESDLYKLRFSELGYDIVEDGIYTSRAYYDKYPTQCQAFAEASRDGWIYALNHPEEALQVVTAIMKEHYLPSNISHQRWMLDKIGESILAKPTNLGSLLREDFDKAKALMLSQNPALSELTFEEFHPRAVTGLK